MVRWMRATTTTLLLLTITITVASTSALSIPPSPPPPVTTEQLQQDHNNLILPSPPPRRSAKHPIHHTAADDASIDIPILSRRQSQSEASNSTLASNSAATAWDAATSAACMARMVSLNGKASNEAGLAVCYNIPFLDNSTGIFQADLRVYQISPPSGDFATLSAQEVQVSIRYFGASVSLVDPGPGSATAPLPPDGNGGSQAAQRQRRQDAGNSATTTTPTPTPVQIQHYLFAGAITPSLLLPPSQLNTTYLQGLLIPQLLLRPRANSSSPDSSQSQPLILPNSEALFLVGVFSSAPSAEELNAQNAASLLEAAREVEDAPFILPGTRIEVFPIGGVVTGVWALLLVGVVGTGAWEKRAWREVGRRRVEREGGRVG